MRKMVAMGMACVFGLSVSVFAQDITVQGVADPENGGKVTGSAVMKPGKSVTLTASPAKGWVFTAWHDGGKAAKRVVSPAEAAANTNEAGVAVYTATFLPIVDLPVPVVTAIDGVVTGMVGVAFSLPVGYDSLSAVTLTATKLPGGLSLKNGVIAGVPKKAGVAMVTLTATNPKGKSAPVDFTVEILPLPLSAQGTFTGYFSEQHLYPASDPGETITNKFVVGTFTVTVSAAGKLSAKVVTEKGKVSFSAKSWAERDGVLLTAEVKPSKGGEVLALTLDTSQNHLVHQLSGDIAGGVFDGAAWEGLAQKKAFSSKGSAASDVLFWTCFCMDTARASYNVGFFNLDMTALGNAGYAPQGNGYLAITLKTDGSAKFAGKMADGKSISGSTTPLVLPWEGNDTQVNLPLYVPMYSGRGSFSVLLLANTELPLTLQSYFLKYLPESPARWVYLGKAPTAKPPQTEDAFEATLACVGSVYSSDMNLGSVFYVRNERFTIVTPDLLFTYTKGGYADTVGARADLLPDVRINPSTMTLPTGNVNPAQATFSVTKSSGIFKGKFNVNYDYTDEKGATKQKTVSVKHEGVVLPYYVNSLYPSGAGFYTMPDTWVDTTDPKKPVTYKLNRSFGVSIVTP